MKIELALTGTALPVVMSILPSPFIQFNECSVGGIDESVIQLRNDSADLPICYAVRKVAHFHAFPVCGYIEVNQIKDLLITFQPKQIGEFNCHLLLDIIGQVCDMDQSGQPVFKKAVMESHYIQISGTASSLPLIKHQTSTKDVEKNRSEVESNYVMKTNTSFLNLNATGNGSKKKVNVCVKVAHPDDRASSIRPSNRKEIVRYTLFTFGKLINWTQLPPCGVTDGGNKNKISLCEFCSYIFSTVIHYNIY